jgi:glycine dehydrogenase subunit 1
MARRLTKRDRVIVSRCVHPDYRKVTETYLGGPGGGQYVETPIGDDGTASKAAIESALGEDAACVVVGYPSFYGGIPDVAEIARLAHARGALLVTACSEPYALSVAESPGALGADIAAGEGQPLACPPSFGGPGVGLFACRDDRQYLQQLPGRLCGATVDTQGKRGFVLTLSTREQHIRRERATSNICTNQGLLALSLCIRMSMLGKRAFVETGKQCLSKATYLRERILALRGYSAAFAAAPFFNEFTVRVRGASAASLCSVLEAKGIIAGLDLGRVDPGRADCLLVAVTERHAKAELDALVTALDAI